MAARKIARESATTNSYDAFTAAGEAARDQYETALKAFNESAEKIRAQTEEHFATAREGYEAASERMRAVSADAVAHAREEMTEAVDFVNELARAKSVNDALELQRDYWTRLYETRVERVRAMTEASVEATRNAFEPFNRSFSSAFAFAPSFDKFFPFQSK